MKLVIFKMITVFSKTDLPSHSSGKMQSKTRKTHKYSSSSFKGTVFEGTKFSQADTQSLKLLKVQIRIHNQVEITETTRV